MSEPNRLSKERMTEAEITAVLSLYVESDVQSGEYTDMTIGQIMEKSEKLKENTLLTEALRSHPEMMDYVLISQSSDYCPMSELISCAFADKNGNIYVVYRGTGDGKWIDNAEGLMQEKSFVQQKAQEYFDYVIEKYNGNINRVVVSGHSKGGNLAQYVTLMAKYADLIKACYSFDGQGFSKEALEMFKKKWKDEYEDRLKIMYSINGENDYVHDLGIPIIPEENTVHIRTTNGNGFFEWHVIFGLFRSDGTINWDYCNRGPVGRLIQEVMEELMTLNDEEFDACAIALMSLLELFLGNEYEYYIGTGNRAFATHDELQTFFNNGVPLIFNVLIRSENTEEILRLFSVDESVIEVFLSIHEYAEENGIEDIFGYLQEEQGRVFEIPVDALLSADGVTEELIKFLAGEELYNKIVEYLSKVSVYVIDETLVNVVTDFLARIVILIVAYCLIAKQIKKIVEELKFAWDEFIHHLEEIATKIYDWLNNEFIPAVIDYVDRIISEVARELVNVYNFVADKVEEFTNAFEVAVNAIIKNAPRLLVAAFNPVAYSVIGSLASVSVDMPKLLDATKRMEEVARRVAAVDVDLNNLFVKIAVENITGENGILTSLANLYNVVSADLNVCGAYDLTLRANIIRALYSGCDEVQKKILDYVPQIYKVD